MIQEGVEWSWHLQEWAVGVVMELDLEYCQGETLNYVDWDQEEGLEKQCVTQEGVNAVLYCQREGLNDVDVVTWDQEERMEKQCVTQEGVNAMCMEYLEGPIVVGYAITEGT